MFMYLNEASLLFADRNRENGSKVHTKETQWVVGRKTTTIWIFAIPRKSAVNGKYCFIRVHKEHHQKPTVIHLLEDTGAFVTSRLIKV